MASAEVPAASPEPSARPTAELIGPAGDGPWIAYTWESATGSTSRIMVVGVDDGPPTRLIEGDHNRYFCHSADDRLIAFWSDQDVPFENFVYVSNADGSQRRLVSETASQFWCRFSASAILLEPNTAAGSIHRHDLATGEETQLIDGVEQLQASPDGSRYLAVVSNPGGRSLEIVDVADGARFAIHGPLTADENYASLTWSPDGSVVYFVVEPASGGPGDRQVFTTPSGGSAAEPRALASAEGYTPRLAASNDGQRLLLTTSSATGPHAVTVVDVASGVAETLAQDGVWAGWHPTEPDTLALATPESLSLHGPSGEPREVAAVPDEGICPDCEGDGAPRGEWGWGETWIGWSPDGRYIGLPDFAPAVVVVDVETGELRVLTEDSGGGFVFGPRWLP